VARFYRVREGVFSSTGFRIRAAQPAAATPQVVHWAERVAASLFFTLFPADCRICGSPLLQVSRLPVCQECLHALRPLSGPRCGVCEESFDSPIVLDHPEAPCRICQSVAPPFERAVAYGSYDGPLRDLVHLLKFQQVRPAAPVLGRLLADAIAGLEPSLPPGTIAVIPVPLHAHKKSQRGFNQAELIVREALKQSCVGRTLLSAHAGLPLGADRGVRPTLHARPGLWRDRFELRAHTLERVRDTGSQIGLTRHQRRQNLRGAFAVKDAAAISGRDVLLVDDVYTTGATASECARVLRRAGAARVWVATVARTLKGHDFFAAPEELSQKEIQQESEARPSLAAHA